MYPAIPYGRVVAATEVVCGLAFTAILTGLTFVRFSRPRAKMVFAANPVVAIHNGKQFVDHDAITLIHDFIGHLWSGPRRQARIYLQHEDLPLILTMAQSGEYARAMASEEEMTELVDHLCRERDRHANMDF